MDDWHLKLFNKSVVKQKKFHYLKTFLGDYANKRCLDLGSDNGVISYLLRRSGGTWSSADIEDQTVELIRNLVNDNVYKIEGAKTTFPDDSFDLVVIVDLLEHIENDKELINEISRILKKDGMLIVNVPHKKKFSVIRFIRNLLGLTDEQHGHVREGYAYRELKEMLTGYRIEKRATYSKSFTETVDMLVSFAFSILSKKRESRKGVLVSKEDMRKYNKIFLVYTVMYPFMWLFSKLDFLLFFLSGYRLIVRARRF